jgi:hypothetical protein
VNRRLTVVPLVATALFALAACSQTTTGSGNPASTTTPGSSGGTTSTNSGGGASTASLQPCDLLSASVLSQNQLTKTDSGTQSGARTCAWTKSVDINGNGGYTLGIDIRDSQGLTDTSDGGYTVTPETVGSHQGKQLERSGSCIVAIGVSTTSRVDVQASADPGQSYPLANQFAKLIEPGLPGGGS